MDVDNGHDHAVVKSAPYLPPEILDCIAGHLFNQGPQKNGSREMALRLRQKDFYNFCRVSRDWYLAGIGYLYAWPYFPDSKSVTRFTSTLWLPGTGIRGWATIKLASLVTTIDLGNISPGYPVTVVWRLLDRVKNSLVNFVAPSLGVGRTCLDQLSQCQNLRIADFSRTETKFITFLQFQETIFTLPRLEKLALPRSMKITQADVAAKGWPPTLTFLQLGQSQLSGLSPAVVLPSTLTEWSFDLYRGFRPGRIVDFCQQYPHLKGSIKRLHIQFGRGLSQAIRIDVARIAADLLNLTYLRVPLDYFHWLFRSRWLPSAKNNPLSSIRILELTGPSKLISQGNSRRIISGLRDNLTDPLINVVGLGITSEVRDLLLSFGAQAMQNLEEKIANHLEAAADYKPAPLEQVGIYTIASNEKNENEQWNLLYH